MEPAKFFTTPNHPLHRQYEAIRAFFVDNLTAEEVASRYGYTKSTVYSLTRDFQQQLQHSESLPERFFNSPALGRKPAENHDQVREQIISLRKKYLSIPDIKAILDSREISLSERYVHKILREEGFARLPRRSKIEKQSAIRKDNIEAPKSHLLSNSQGSFSSIDAGALLFLHYIKLNKIDVLIDESNYPGTKQIPKLNSILAFIALKLSNIRRYTSDDLWCMDRGLGLFAGLNVLPKAAWYTSYSSRITRQMNLSFLKSMYALWVKQGLLSGTVNMDFVAVPYWGEDTHLENNWSGTRHQALQSILAALAHDPDTGIITYGDASIRHEDGVDTAIEFLDFYKKSGGEALKYLVFDSKFTTYENLRKIDDNDVKFVTIRRRGKKIIEELNGLSKEKWCNVRVATAYGKTRQIQIHESRIKIKSYGKDKEIRQVAITGHGKIKPALIITNDFDLGVTELVRKYARRWLVEKTISEQTHFFHLNRLSSSMVIKVDFDLTMTILAHNLYRLLANDLPGHENNTAQSLFEKFIYNEGTIEYDEKKLIVKLKKKRHLPMILESLENKTVFKLPWLENRELHIEGATTT